MKTTQFDNLKTVNNFAKSMNITPAYIYKMIGVGKIMPIEIDGIKFIDTAKTKISLTRK